MNIFWRMLLGHLLADFTLQTNALAAWKRVNLAGMAVHTAIHPLLYVALVSPFLNQVWVAPWGVPLGGWTCVGLVYLGHFLHDEFRVTAIGRRGSLDNIWFFSWDQVVHIAVLCLLTPFWREVQGGYVLIPEKWPVIACLFVVATHFTTVVVYFLEKALWGGFYPTDREKYLGICERAAMVGLFLLPDPLWAAVGCAAWIAWRAWLKTRWGWGFRWLGFAMGAGLTLVCGALARWIAYS